MAFGQGLSKERCKFQMVAGLIPKCGGTVRACSRVKVVLRSGASAH